MIAIDYRDKRPLYEQVTEKLAQLIICGALESNTKLPSVRSLALELSINPNTIQRAYTQLEQDGYIYTVVGRGNYVTDVHEWKKGYQSAVTKELKTALQKAREAGLPLEEVMAMTRSCYASPPGGQAKDRAEIPATGREGSPADALAVGQETAPDQTLTNTQKEDFSND